MSDRTARSIEERLKAVSGATDGIARLESLINAEHELVEAQMKAVEEVFEAQREINKATSEATDGIVEQLSNLGAFRQEAVSVAAVEQPLQALERALADVWRSAVRPAGARRLTVIASLERAYMALDGVFMALNLARAEPEDGAE